MVRFPCLVTRQKSAGPPGHTVGLGVSDLRVVLKVLVFGLYLGDHFSWFKGLAKVSRKKTRKDYTSSPKMCDSSVVQ